MSGNLKFPSRSQEKKISESYSGHFLVMRSPNVPKTIAITIDKDGLGENYGS